MITRSGPLMVRLTSHRIHFMVEVPVEMVAVYGLLPMLRRGWKCARELRQQWQLYQLGQPGPSRLVH